MCLDGERVWGQAGRHAQRHRSRKVKGLRRIAHSPVGSSQTSTETAANQAQTIDALSGQLVDDLLHKADVIDALIEAVVH